MKRRTLNDDGSFTNFKGPKPTYKVVPQEQKIAERKALVDRAHQHGFNPNSPVEGGLSKADEKFLEGASPEATAALYETRGIEAPKVEGDKTPATSEGLSEEDKEVIKAGISIPEMRKLAKDKGLTIPGDKKKAVDIQAFLLGEPKEEDTDL